MSPDAIARTFAAAGTQVRLVVLNACFTEPIAEALLAHIDCVVGMSGAIHDDTARSFAIGFYGGLGEHESIAAAFEQGKAAIDLEELPDAERPRLKVRDGFDAAQLILAAAMPPVLVDVPCPYPGMRPYAADDANGFHGRSAEITDLIGRLRAGEREIYVIGPSGSGKSSLVAAGILPRLARGVTGLGSFVVRELRPGEQPAARLCQALEVPAGQRLVGADCLAALLGHHGPHSSVRAERRWAVIFTLRADFFGALMESPLWAEHRGQLSRVEVSPLRGEALREAIVAPARDVGVVVKPALIERLLADAASEPGILPLLQETMVQLWEARSDQTLTLADYQGPGDGERSGLAVTLARRADAALRRLTPVQTQIAHRILLRLVSFGEGRSDTRRQQPRAKLRTAGDDEADLAYVLQTMIDHRLLTIYEEGGEPRVDLGHEIMIMAWPTLAGWIRSHRVDEQRRRLLEAAAAQWVEHGRGARGLLDPFELADAEKWQHTESALALGQSAEVMALIAASRAEHVKRVNEAREQTNKVDASERRSRWLLAQSHAESGRQLLVEGRAQEAVPYFLAARQNGEDKAPLRMMFWTAIVRDVDDLADAVEERTELLGRHRPVPVQPDIQREARHPLHRNPQEVALVLGPEGVDVRRVGSSCDASFASRRKRSRESLSLRRSCSTLTTTLRSSSGCSPRYTAP